MGAQWLNIRVFDPRPIQAVASSSITGVTVLCPWAVEERNIVEFNLVCIVY